MRKIGEEKVYALLWAIVLTVGCAYIFYNSCLGLLFGALVGLYAYKAGVERIRTKREQRILGQFKSLIIAMQGALEAGNSIENSLISARRDLEKMYGEGTELARELRIFEKKLSLRLTTDQALKEFAETMELTEIKDFVEVISTIKRTGGNAIKVIKDTVDKLIAEIELREELEVMVASKKLEQQIMIYMPAFIILFLRTSNKGFLDPLYGNATGIVIMTVVLATNVGADFLGKKIIKVN